MNLTNPNILLINSDETISTIYSYNFERYGFIVNLVKNSDSSLIMFEQIKPDIVIIDDNIDLNSDSKFSCRELVSIFKNKELSYNFNIIIITNQPDIYQPLQNKNNSSTKVLTKPFSASELVKLVKENFTSTKPKAFFSALEYKDIKLNIQTYKVTRNGKQVNLGPTEFKILQCLMELPNKVLSREHIMNHVWGMNSRIEPRTIDVHINRLRSALDNDNINKPIALIRTVRAAGYCLSAG
jgi:two-component system, OmpR family, phosphate regulon response regulator PhoB